MGEYLDSNLERQNVTETVIQLHINMQPFLSENKILNRVLNISLHAV